MGLRNIVRAPDSGHAANPTFLDTQERSQFRKYVSNIGNATEPEMATIEYICSFDSDTHGEGWVVNEELKGVVQLTKEYYEIFFADFDRSPDPNTYYFNKECFDSMLARVRSDMPLQEEAQKWKAGLEACYDAVRTGVLDKCFVRCDSA